MSIDTTLQTLIANAKSAGADPNKVEWDGTGNLRDVLDEINSRKANNGESVVINGGDGRITDISLKATSAGFKRNDAVSIIRKTNGDLLACWTNYNTENTNDEGPALIFGATSSNNGASWTTGSVLLDGVAAIGTYIPSLYRVNSTTLIMIVFGQDTTTTGQLYKSVSTDDGVTWGTATLLYTEGAGGYFAQAPDRIFRTSTGRLLFPFGRNTNGILDSASGYYDGRFLKSTDNGTTWSVITSTITSPDNLCAESGIYEAVPGTLTCYWRSRSGFVYAANSTDDGETWGGVYKTGLAAPNTMSSIIFEPKQKILIAAVNRGTTNRYNMDLWLSHDLGINWQPVLALAENAGTYNYFEPTIFLDSAAFIVAFSEQDVATGANVSLIGKSIPFAKVPLWENSGITQLSIKKVIQSGDVRFYEVRNYGNDTGYLICENGSTASSVFSIVETYKLSGSIAQGHVMNYDIDGATTGGGFIAQLVNCIKSGGWGNNIFVEYQDNGSMRLRIANDRVDCTMTGGWEVPSGTTSQRPTVGADSRYIRYNETTAHFEGYNGSSWVNLDV